MSDVKLVADDEASSLRSRLAWMTRDRDRLMAEVERLRAEIRDRELSAARSARSYPEPEGGGACR